jgi:M6 family metalloprotease-like protein
MRFIPIFLVGVSLLFGSEKLVVTDKRPANAPLRRHPIESLMPQSEPVRMQRGPSRLAVLLVDFVADSVSTTTGDGKFIITTPVADEPTVGAGPHDRTYFEKLCKSVAIYWETASMGLFNLEYTVFPDSGAYTLPNTMDYYNPAGAGSDLMLERYIQYFQDILHTADADPDLDFSQFDQVMVIHAGSDWQHDINGDTPCDMPSFHIHVAPDKTVTVDDGIVIDNLANVPEMITQDVSMTMQNGIKVYSGYGVTNAVMAHEFGHNLGLVDLYSSTDNRPAVGYWDIMDSGGSVSLGLPKYDSLDNLTAYYYIEGAIPAFPSAWSRQLLWGDAFRARGYLKDISDFDLTQPIELLTVGTTVEPGPQQAYMVRVPITDTEYLLLENRQVDHDMDGQTTLFSDNINNPRVVLFPTGWNDSSDTPDEYDYALPGWTDANGLSYGGGLLVWRVDDSIIYGLNSDGETNFAANTVNTKHYHRGVSILEADGMDDIGNYSSLYWTGTQYEPFFPFKPELDTDSNFIGWGIEAYKDSLSASTTPALATYAGDPIPFRIYDVTGEAYSRPFEKPANKITFRFATTFFDKTCTVPLTTIDSLRFIGGACMGNTESGTLASQIPVVSASGIDDLQHVYQTGLLDEWQNPFNTFDPGLIPDFAPVAFDWDGNGTDETVVASGQLMRVLEGDDYIDGALCPETITRPPLCLHDANGTRKIVLSGTEHLYIYGTETNTPVELSLAQARTAYGSGILAAVTDKALSILPLANQGGLQTFSADFSGNGEPVVYTDDSRTCVFVPASDGSIYRYTASDGLTRVFPAPAGLSASPSQLALGTLGGQSAVVFGLGDMLYAIRIDGTLVPGFPVKLYKNEAAAWSNPRIVHLDGEAVILFRNDRNGCIAINERGEDCPAYSLGLPGVNDDQLYYESSTSRLTYVYPLRLADGQMSMQAAWRIEPNNPLDWSGYRNGATGFFRGSSAVVPSVATFDACAFPSPAKDGQVRFRVYGAQAPIEVKVFDIAGNLVFKTTVSAQSGEYQDNIVWDTSKVASGAYFGVLKSGSHNKTLRIGVEN